MLTSPGIKTIRDSHVRVVHLSNENVAVKLLFEFEHVRKVVAGTLHTSQEWNIIIRFGTLYIRLVRLGVHPMPLIRPFSKAILNAVVIIHLATAEIPVCPPGGTLWTTLGGIYSADSPQTSNLGDKDRILPFC